MSVYRKTNSHRRYSMGHDIHSCDTELSNIVGINTYFHKSIPKMPLILRMYQVTRMLSWYKIMTFILNIDPK